MLRLARPLPPGNGERQKQQYGAHLRYLRFKSSVTRHPRGTTKTGGPGPRSEDRGGGRTAGDSIPRDEETGEGNGPNDMDSMLIIAGAVVVLAIGLGAGYILQRKMTAERSRLAEQKAREAMEEAKREAEALRK